MLYMDSIKSTFGYVFTLRGATVSCRSIKQKYTTNSTTETKYVTATEDAKEAVRLKKFLLELGVVSQAQLPITLYCDNNVVVA